MVNDSSGSSAQTRHGPRQPQGTPGLSRKVTASSGLQGIATACMDTSSSSSSSGGAAFRVAVRLLGPGGTERVAGAGTGGQGHGVVLFSCPRQGRTPGGGREAVEDQAAWIRSCLSFGQGGGSGVAARSASARLVPRCSGAGCSRYLVCSPRGALTPPRGTWGAARPRRCRGASGGSTGTPGRAERGRVAAAGAGRGRAALRFVYSPLASWCHPILLLHPLRSSRPFLAIFGFFQRLIHPPPPHSCPQAPRQQRQARQHFLAARRARPGLAQSAAPAGSDPRAASTITKLHSAAETQPRAQPPNAAS